MRARCAGSRSTFLPVFFLYAALNAAVTGVVGHECAAADCAEGKRCSSDGAGPATLPPMSVCFTWVPLAMYCRTRPGFVPR